MLSLSLYSSAPLSFSLPLSNAHIRMQIAIKIAKSCPNLRLNNLRDWPNIWLAQTVALALTLSSSFSLTRLSISQSISSHDDNDSSRRQSRRVIRLKRERQRESERERGCRRGCSSFGFDFTSIVFNME